MIFDRKNRYSYFGLSTLTLLRNRAESSIFDISEKVKERLSFIGIYNNSDKIELLEAENNDKQIIVEKLANNVKELDLKIRQMLIKMLKMKNKIVEME